MSKKIGRNDKCPWGSGKKYKFCCLGKTEQEKYWDTVLKSTKNLKYNSRIKQCLHPDKEHCRENIIKAHAIQNNRILKKIAENGEVITTDGVSNIIFQGAQKKGRKIATTFTGFCGYHDKSTFQEIEDQPFVGSEKQVFLFSYRTMAWHVQKKEEQTNANQLMTGRIKEAGYAISSDTSVAKFAEMLQLGLKDNELEIEDFNRALMIEDYSAVKSYIWEIQYEVEFAISMMHELEYDIRGKRINDLSKLERPKKIYLNIFPADGKSYCIWSWLTWCHEDFSVFANQFEVLSDEDKKNYLNNYLPRWSDSLIISPRLWNTLGDDVQQSFLAHANFEPLYHQMEEETGGYAFENMYTPWDLFEAGRAVEP